MDIEIDRLQLHSTNQFVASSIFNKTVKDESTEVTYPLPPFNEINNLRAAVRSLSTSRPLIQSRKVLDVLKQVRSQYDQTRTSSKCPYCRDEMNLMWLLAGKAAVQTFGSVMSTLLDHWP